MEYPDHAQHSECDESRKEKQRQDRKQINDTVKTRYKFPGGLPFCLLGIEKIGRPDPESVFNRKKNNATDLNDRKYASVSGKRFKSLQDHHQDIDDDHEYQTIVEHLAWDVVTLPYL